MSWVPHYALGSFNINADRSFSVVSSRNGIGGIFKDHQRNILLQFKKEVSAKSAIHTEIISIKEGLLITAASRWFSFSHFMLESDSLNVVVWTSLIGSKILGKLFGGSLISFVRVFRFLAARFPGRLCIFVILATMLLMSLRASESMGPISSSSYSFIYFFWFVFFSRDCYLWYVSLVSLFLLNKFPKKLVLEKQKTDWLIKVLVKSQSTNKRNITRSLKKARKFKHTRWIWISGTYSCKHIRHFILGPVNMRYRPLDMPVKPGMTLSDNAIKLPRSWRTEPPNNTLEFNSKSKAKELA